MHSIVVGGSWNTVKFLCCSYHLVLILHSTTVIQNSRLRPECNAAIEETKRNICYFRNISQDGVHHITQLTNAYSDLV
jgi:hypothetical protein